MHTSPPADLDGESLVPLLKNPATSTGRVVATFFDPGNVSLRSDRHRYIRYADGSEELYNLEEDPNEWDNLADQPDFQSIFQAHAAKLPETNAPLDPKERKKKKSK